MKRLWEWVVGRSGLNRATPVTRKSILPPLSARLECTSRINLRIHYWFDRPPWQPHKKFMSTQTSRIRRGRVKMVVLTAIQEHGSQAPKAQDGDGDDNNDSSFRMPPNCVRPANSKMNCLTCMHLYLISFALHKYVALFSILRWVLRLQFRPC